MKKNLNEKMVLTRPQSEMLIKGHNNQFEFNPSPPPSPLESHA